MVRDPCRHQAQYGHIEDFARFWEAEPEPAERRKLILSLFAQVWAQDRRIVAVKPNPAFALLHRRHRGSNPAPKGQCEQ